MRKLHVRKEMLLHPGDLPFPVLQNRLCRAGDTKKRRRGLALPHHAHEMTRNLPAQPGKVLY